MAWRGEEAGELKDEQVVPERGRSGVSKGMQSEKMQYALAYGDGLKYHFYRTEAEQGEMGGQTGSYSF